MNVIIGLQGSNSLTTRTFYFDCNDRPAWAVLKVQFSVIASEVKQTMMLNLNGLLRSIAFAMTKKENFKTAPGKSSAPAL